MGVTDAVQNEFEVGAIVNVPCEVTAIGGTTANPTVTLETKYAGFDGNKDTLGPINSNQVIIDK